MKTFLMSGKKFSEVIKAARSGGKRFIRYQNIVINIQTNTDQILVSKFTKLHRPVFAGDFSSPLVGIIRFDDRSLLTPIESLLGAGFQFLVPHVRGLYNEPQGILVFHVGCMVLDYIRKTSHKMNPESAAMSRPEINPETTSFSSYATGKLAGAGETFLAGCRITFTSLKTCQWNS